MFKQRLGERPAIQSILTSTSIVEEKDLPKNGAFKGYDSKCNSADEVEAVILNNTNDILLLRSLHDVGKSSVGVDIIANWNKETRSGNF